MVEVFAFACSHKNHPEWRYTIYNALTAGKARYQYFLDVREPWPDVKLIDLRARKIGPAHSSEGFIHNAIYRGMPDVRCGRRVRTNGCDGVIVGHNSSANFNVLFETGKYAGQTLNVHPSEIELLPASPEPQPEKPA